MSSKFLRTSSTSTSFSVSNASAAFATASCRVSSTHTTRPSLEPPPAVVPGVDPPEVSSLEPPHAVSVRARPSATAAAGMLRRIVRLL
jgi:hypothetical protein